MTEIVDDHPAMLKNPEPVIQLHELADSSCNFRLPSLGQALLNFAAVEYVP